MGRAERKETPASDNIFCLLGFSLWCSVRTGIRDVFTDDVPTPALLLGGAKCGIVLGIEVCPASPGVTG